jgi:hypothetical protein
MQNMYQNISTKEITYLKDLDKRITINKKGIYSYNNNNCNYETFLELHHNNVYHFLKELDDKTKFMF